MKGKRKKAKKCDGTGANSHNERGCVTGGTFAIASHCTPTKMIFSSFIYICEMCIQLFIS